MIGTLNESTRLGRKYGRWMECDAKAGVWNYAVWTYDPNRDRPFEIEEYGVVLVALTATDNEISAWFWSNVEPVDVCKAIVVHRRK